MSKILNHAQHIFPGGDEKLSRGASPPLRPPGYGPGFNCVTIFELATLNSYILFLHWQHNWHPYRKLASCYICFVLSLHSGI